MRLNTALTLRLLLFVVATSLATPAHSEGQQQHEQISAVIRTTPAAWYFEGGKSRGIDHDLLTQFAEFAGLQLEITYAPDTDTALKTLCSPRVQLAAGLLSLTPHMKRDVRVSPDYGTTRPQLIRHFSQPRIKTTSELVMETLEVGAEPTHLELLASIKESNSDHTQWKLHSDIDAHSRINLIDHSFIEHTIVDSHAMQMTRRFYPRVKEGIYLGSELPLNWVFGQCADDALVESSRKFLTAAKSDGTLAQIFDRHLGHTGQLDYPGKLAFLEKVVQRLERYKPDFVRIAGETALDWRLLAALSYQESHWNPAARSPSGVEGFMMLTLDVARKFDVENRKDPDQSIRGGAYFLLDLKKRLPSDVKEPDRTWLALAAYNAGLENVRNAMRQARNKGLNPSLWINTSNFLHESISAATEPKLGKSLNNPRFFVYNIRAYQDLLAWNDQVLRFYEYATASSSQAPSTTLPPPAPM